MQMKQFIFVLVLSFLFVSQLSGQSSSNGSVKIIQDSRVEQLLLIHSRFKLAHPETEGYKIQIFMDSGNDAVDRANSVVDNFSVNFPEIPVDLTYGAPYYRVRAGNFRSRIEAEGYLKKILPYFSQAFITKDKIRL